MLQSKIFICLKSILIYSNQKLLNLHNTLGTGKIVKEKVNLSDLIEILC